MLVNDIKKGAELLLTGSRRAVMADNARGVIRMVKIKPENGWFEEFGSVYVTEIVRVMNPATQAWEPVALSPAQSKKLGRIDRALAQLAA